MNGEWKERRVCGGIKPPHPTRWAFDSESDRLMIIVQSIWSYCLRNLLSAED